MNFKSENATLKKSAEFKMLQERMERIQEMKKTVEFLQNDYENLYSSIKQSKEVPDFLITEYLAKKEF